MASWEYKTVQHELTGSLLLSGINEVALVKSLHAADAQGWELVSAVPIGMEGGSTREIIMIMRRPRSNPSNSAAPGH